MAERDTTRHLINAMKGWDPVRIENILAPGTPDINFTGGWIEVKWIQDYPKKEGEIIICDHFTPAQRAFLKRRALMGGKTYLFVTIRKDHYLFDGLTGADFFGWITKEIMQAKCLGYWQKVFPKKSELLMAMLKFKGVNP